MKVTADPAGGASTCVRDQRVYLHVYGPNDTLAFADLEADGTASFPIPLLKRGQPFSIDLSAAGPVGRCAPFRTLYDAVPGYGEPAQVTTSIAGPGGAGSALEAGNTTNVGMEVRGRVVASSALCVSGTIVDLIAANGVTHVGGARTEQDGSFTLHGNWDPKAAGGSYTVRLDSFEYPLTLCKGAAATVKMPAAAPDPEPNRGFTTTKLTASFTPEIGPLVKASGAHQRLSGYLDAQVELTGGERKPDCLGVAATVHVGQRQDGFVGRDGKAHVLVTLGIDEYDATITMDYGPYTAAFCRPPAPVVVHIPALDDGLVNAEKGEFPSYGAASAKIPERCQYGGVPRQLSTRGTQEIWEIHCYGKTESKVENGLKPFADGMTGWLTK